MDNTAYEHDLKQYNNDNNSKDAEVGFYSCTHDLSYSYIFQASKQTPLSEEEIKAEKRIIYKNVLLISVAFLLLFVAFESMSKLQSSINVVRQHLSLIVLGLIGIILINPGEQPWYLGQCCCL